MPAYSRFATFYDLVMDDPRPRADRVDDWITRFHPRTRTLLELGCGTGSILERLPASLELTGLDRSPEMLAIASEKVPGARLVQADMGSFALDARFDVVICVFDSLNHLLTADEWRSTVAAVDLHLNDGGLFLFDVNTVGELRRLGEEPPEVYDFEGGVAIIDVEFAQEGSSLGSSVWDVRVFEHSGGAGYVLHHERIGEVALPLASVRSMLEPRFELLDEVSERGDAPTDDSVKAHFAYRRLPPGSRPRSSP